MIILYVAHVRLPTQKAHGLQIVKTCEALASSGARVVLIAMLRNGSTAEDIYETYGVKTRFMIHTINIPKLYWLGKIGFWLSEFIFALYAWRYFRKENTDVAYSRDELPLLFAPEKIFIAYEAHTPRWNVFTRKVTRRVNAFFTISHGLKNFYEEKGVPTELMPVVPDAVDISVFQDLNFPQECRKRLKIPEYKKIITYTGHLYPEKGAHILAEASSYIANEADVYIVGGLFSDVKSFQGMYGGSRLHIIGQRPRGEIPLWLCASDILILPNVGTNRTSAEFTSPMKLFEYIASGRPIIASNVPALREVLTDDMAYFFEADNPQDLVVTIKKVLENPEEASRKALRARKEAEKYTWDMRARKIFDELTKRISD